MMNIDVSLTFFIELWSSRAVCSIEMILNFKLACTFQLSMCSLTIYHAVLR